MAVARGARASDRVDESKTREPSGRSGREGVKADQGDDVGHDQRVPKPRERLASAEVDPEQHECDNCELRAPVRERHEGVERARVARKVLQTQFDEPVHQIALELCDAESVCERPTAVVAGSGLDQLVAEDEREPEGGLQRQVDRPPGRP